MSDTPKEYRIIVDKDNTLKLQESQEESYGWVIMFYSLYDRSWDHTEKGDLRDVKTFTCRAPDKKTALQKYILSSEQDNVRDIIDLLQHYSEKRDGKKIKKLVKIMYSLYSLNNDTWDDDGVPKTLLEFSHEMGGETGRLFMEEKVTFREMVIDFLSTGVEEHVFNIMRI